MNKVSVIQTYLDELFEDPRCELEYSKDYELLIAVVLSAQTTDKKVNLVTKKMFNRYPSLKALKEADIDELKDILRPLGMYQKKAIFVKEIAYTLCDKSNGQVINDRFFLEGLSGVGRKTANVIMAVLFNEPCIAVDTHVERVSKRLGLVDKKDDVLRIEDKLTKLFDKNLQPKIHYQLVLFGRYHCMAKKPNCCYCKLNSFCIYNKKHL